MVAFRHGRWSRKQLTPLAASTKQQDRGREAGRGGGHKLEVGEAFCSQSQSLNDVLPPVRLYHLVHPQTAPLTGDQVNVEMPKPVAISLKPCQGATLPIHFRNCTGPLPVLRLGPEPDTDNPISRESIGLSLIRSIGL